jgi:hypothetical protein
MLRKMTEKKILIVLLATLALFSGCLLIPLDEKAEAQFAPSAVTLTENIWTDGLDSSDKEHWFKFTASGSLSYIHYNSGVLNYLYVQLYDSNGNTIGDMEEIWGFDSAVYSYSTVGQEYYIKITPNKYSSFNDTYKIAFNTSPEAPVAIKIPSNAIRLNADTFTDGDIPISGGEQWFKFTATADKQYIHINFETLTNLHIQLYKIYDGIYGFPLGEDTEILNYDHLPKYTGRTLNAGEEYYIKVSTHYHPFHYRGSYKIAFSALFVSPVFDIKTLTSNVWTEGDFTKEYEVHWYKFTATAAEQYIHASFGTMDDWSGIRIQVYDADGKAVGGEGQLREDPFDPNGKYTSRTLETGKVYYIKVYLYTYLPLQLGTYKITINATAALPPVTPPSNATVLLPIYSWYNNFWFNSYLTAGNAQWFKFIATYAYPQYIHINLGALNSDDVYIQLIDSNGYIISELTPLQGFNNNYIIPLPVYPGQLYYIRVGSHNKSGDFKIAFSTLPTPPLLP